MPVRCNWPLSVSRNAGHVRTRGNIFRLPRIHNTDCYLRQRVGEIASRVGALTNLKNNTAMTRNITESGIIVSMKQVVSAGRTYSRKA